MRRAALLALILAAGACGVRAGQRPTFPEPPVDTRAEARAPDLSQLEGWSGKGVTASRPVRFVPAPNGQTLQAVVLGREEVDDRELLLVVARLGGQVIATAPLARVRIGGASRRVVLSEASRWPLGGGQTGLRVDVSVFESAPPRRFAVKTVIVDVTAGDLHIILDRLVESGDDSRDRHATLAARDVDGDGAPELIIDERESGAKARRLVYKRDAHGVYATRDRSLFDE